MYQVAIIMGILLGALPTGKLRVKTGEYTYTIMKKGKEIGIHKFVIRKTKSYYEVLSAKKIKPEEGGNYEDSIILYLDKKTKLPVRADVWTKIHVGKMGPINQYYDISFGPKEIEVTSIAEEDTTPHKTVFKSEETPWLIEPLGFLFSGFSLKKGEKYNFKLFFPTTKEIEDATLEIGDTKRIKTLRGKKMNVTKFEVNYRGRRFIYWVDSKTPPYLYEIEDKVLEMKEIAK